jgi:transcriptional regulator with XRE-family HTH domain
MSQRELARISGVTNGTISMIEQNKISPSVASLKKILGAIGLSLGQFFSDDWQPETNAFFRADDLKELADGATVSLRQVGHSVLNRKMQVLHERYAAGGDTGDSMLAHDGEEAGVIVRGQVEITVGNNVETLGPGDAYYFDSRMPHRFRNVSDEECEIVSVCTPPTF